MTVDRALLLTLAGTGLYVLYRIRKTVQVIELNDVDFWRQLGELREMAPRAV